MASLVRGTGSGGAIAITAQSMLLDGSSTSIASTTAGAELTDPFGNRIPAGAGGIIGITAGTLTLRNHATVIAATLGDGPGGAISVAVSDALTIDGRSMAGFTSLGPVPGIPLSPTGILSVSEAAGNAGSLTVSAGNLSIASNGAIASLSTALGNGGDVAVGVTGTLAIDGTSAGSQTGIASLAFGPGSAGTVAISAGEVSVLNNGGDPEQHAQLRKRR
jgi:hypothetical protein